MTDTVGKVAVGTVDLAGKVVNESVDIAKEVKDDSNSCRFLSILKATTKTKRKRIAIAFKVKKGRQLLLLK